MTFLKLQTFSTLDSMPLNRRCAAERVKVMAVWNFDGPGPIDNFLPASTAKSALKVSIYLLHRCIMKEARALEL